MSREAKYTSPAAPSPIIRLIETMLRDTSSRTKLSIADGDSISTTVLSISSSALASASDYNSVKYGIADRVDKAYSMWPLQIAPGLRLRHVFKQAAYALC